MFPKCLINQAIVVEGYYRVRRLHDVNERSVVPALSADPLTTCAERLFEGSRNGLHEVLLLFLQITSFEISVLARRFDHSRSLFKCREHGFHGDLEVDAK